MEKLKLYPKGGSNEPVLAVNGDQPKEDASANEGNKKLLPDTDM